MAFGEQTSAQDSRGGAAEKANVLIEASAGTGKTQALAERLIELVKGRVQPQEIVALTFSRAAAGEIFERFVTLLAARAKDDPACAGLLRKVVETQHLSQIGTLSHSKIFRRIF